MEAELKAVGLVLAFATYEIGVLFQTLPIPSRAIKAHGPTLMWDACVVQFAFASAEIIELFTAWISRLLLQGLNLPDAVSGYETAVITTQLTALDSGMILLVASLSSTVLLAPVAALLSQLLGPIVVAVTIALIVWLIIQAVLNVLPTIWMTVFLMGTLFFALPFRIGRSFGTTLMASSIVLTIALPLSAPLALWLESSLGYHVAIQPLQNIIEEAKANPLSLLAVLPALPQSLAGLMVSVVVGLVIFPFAWLFVISMISKNLASLLGGSAVGPPVSSFILTPAWEIGGKLKP